MRHRGVCYRAHHPKWAFTPTSGAGAAIHGGRFNPKGVPALYLALTIEGAVLEIGQGFGLKIAPCTMCSYDVDCADIADLRTADGRRSHDVRAEDLGCAWMNFIAAGRIPPSWTIHDRLIGEGYAGILVPSYAPGASTNTSNLVLWDWSDRPPHQVRTFDPNNSLPRNQDSWP